MPFSVCFLFSISSKKYLRCSVCKLGFYISRVGKYSRSIPQKNDQKKDEWKCDNCLIKLTMDRKMRKVRSEEVKYTVDEIKPMNMKLNNILLKMDKLPNSVETISSIKTSFNFLSDRVDEYYNLKMDSLFSKYFALEQKMQGIELKCSILEREFLELEKNADISKQNNILDNVRVSVVLPTNNEPINCIIIETEKIVNANATTDDIIKVYRTYVPKNNECEIVCSFANKTKNDKLYTNRAKRGHTFPAKIVHSKFKNKKYFSINNSFCQIKRFWGWLNKLLKNINTNTCG